MRDRRPIFSVMTIVSLVVLAGSWCVGWAVRRFHVVHRAHDKADGRETAPIPVVPLVGCRSGPRVDAAAIIEVSTCEHVHHPEAATRIVPRRSSESRVPTWLSFLWGMALLGLLLLPANYRAEAERAHAHSLIQLWADAADGTIRHHHDHGLAHPGPERSSSWFDPAVDGTGTTPSVEFVDERPDTGSHQESAPVSNSVHLLLTMMTAIITLGMYQAPMEDPGGRQSGFSTRIPVPPPRCTPTAL